MIFLQEVPQIKPDSPRVKKHSPQPTLLPPDRIGVQPDRKNTVPIPRPKILTIDIPGASRWTRPGAKSKPR